MSYWEDRLGPENVFTPTDPGDLTDAEIATLEGHDGEDCIYCGALSGTRCRHDCPDWLFLTNNEVGRGHGFIE